ncbi:MAG: hypothetical protein JO100_05370 [Pseudonocardia sp.]|nr:hypothetical protein [Pseudonocardia sp.]
MRIEGITDLAVQHWSTIPMSRVPIVQNGLMHLLDPDDPRTIVDGERV